MYRVLSLAAVVAACTPAGPDPLEPLPFVGNGYRSEGDYCRIVGENDFTNQFLGDASDLVGCPAGAENLGVFVTETNASLVAQYGETNLYTVPVR